MSINPLDIKRKALLADTLIKSRVKVVESATPFSLEYSGVVGGIHVVNDSAATNVEKLVVSLSSFDEPLVWIVEAGAHSKDLELLRDIIAAKVKTIVAVGSNIELVHRAVWPSTGYFIAADTWDEALDMAILSAKANDTILFSPGCRAAEPFQNFRERGAYFNRLVEIKRQTKNHTL